MSRDATPTVAKRDTRDLQTLYMSYAVAYMLHMRHTSNDLVPYQWRVLV